MYLYFFASGLVNFLISIFFGLFIFSKDPRNKVNITFSLFCFSVAIWSFAYMFWPLSETREGTLFWFQALHVGASFTSIAYLHFVLTWLDDRRKINKVVIITGYILATFFALQTFSPLFIADMIPKFSMRYWAVPGILYHFYLIHFFGFFIYSSFLLLREYLNTAGTKRAQIRLILVGMVLAFLGGSTNYLLWYNINFPPYGNIIVGSYVVLTAYAIVKHRLMDIKLVLKNSSVYFASLSTIIVLVLLVRYIFVGEIIFGHFFVDLITFVLAVSLFPIVKKRYDHIANKYFFSSLYDPQEVIGELSDTLSSSIEDKKIFKAICETLTEAFHTEAVGVLTYDSKHENYLVRLNQGFKTRGIKKFDEDAFLQKKYILKNRLVVLEEIQNKINGNSKKTIKMLNRLGVKVLVPLIIKKKLIGLIVLGAKENKDPYNSEDIAVLKVISTQASIATQNALLFKEVKDFNVKLTKEVKAATKELRVANAKLKKLDQAKSEFISIASHQLRTPLTSIKGFTSLMLEGAYGQLSEAQKKTLNKIFISNERLVMLVEDLLNVSRIEKGKMQYEFAEVDIRNVVENSINILNIQAENKGVDLSFEDQTKGKNLMIKADKRKISEIVGNLIDNALKYTPEGRVKVTLKKKEDHARIEVKDTGIGISQGEISKLFEKFSRGKGVNSLHTGGTGLGLFVVKKLTEAHKGKVWVESEGKGKGSTFIVEFPLVGSKEANSIKIEPPIRPYKIKSTAKSKKKAKTKIKTKDNSSAETKADNRTPQEEESSS